MKNQKGFIVPLLLAIITVLVIGGGVYLYTQNNNSQPQTIQNNAATTTGVYSSDTSPSDVKFILAVGDPGAKVVARGDMNNDGYEDAVVQQVMCGASCSIGLNLFLGLKDNKAELAVTDEGFVGYKSSSAVKSEITEITINNGILSLTGYGLDCGGDESRDDDICTKEKWDVIRTIQYKLESTNGASKYYFKRIDRDEITVKNINVQGMSKYTDTDFGFSFWYPTAWKVSEKLVTNSTNNVWFQDGSVVKKLSIEDPNSNNGITIQEFYSPTSSITELGRTKSASPVGVDQKYYFDSNLHLWMYENITESPSGNRLAGTITPADISNNTMGGLHVFQGATRFDGDSIVPLSAKNFLVISPYDVTGEIRQNELANTVVATNPAVAVHLSADVQTKTVQAEKDAYICSNGSTNPPHCDTN